MTSGDVALKSPTREEYGSFAGRCFKTRPGYSSFTSNSVIPIKLPESESFASLRTRKARSKHYHNHHHHHKPLSKFHGFLTIFVNIPYGKEFEFSIERFRNIAYLKNQISIKGKGVFDVENHDLYCNGVKLNDDYRVIHDIISHGDTILHLNVTNHANSKKGSKNLNLQALSYFNYETEMPSFATDLINVTLEGLQKGHSPVLASEGMGGTYLMPDSTGRKYVSVFKPLDEEPNAANNPRKLAASENGESLKKGIRVGEGALREAAAYGLDHPKSGPRFLKRQEKGFAGVPVSLMVQCAHEGFNNVGGFGVKVGSLQKFVKNCGSCEDFGPSVFPVQEVHKIAVLDIRLSNTDRHAGNILMSYGDDGKIVLVPIDHGYCLPDKFEDCTFEWLNWPQSHTPFSSDTIDYIKSLDAEDDIKQISLCGWDLSPQCARTFRISTMLLKKGAKRGLTPFDIGNFMCRENLNKESAIEELVREAEDANEDVFMKNVSRIMDSRLDKMMK